jgi:hypothetical protein
LALRLQAQQSQFLKELEQASAVGVESESSYPFL